MGASGDPRKKSKDEQAKPLTFDHLRSAKKPITRTLYICLDSDVQTAHAEAAARLEQVEDRQQRKRLLASKLGEAEQAKLLLELDAELDAAEQELAAAEAALEEASVAIRLQSIGRRRFEDLWAAHPPTEEDHESLREQGDPDAKAPYHADTFCPALISACAVEPEMTPEEAAILAEEWNGPEYTMLFTAAMDVCNRSNVSAVGKGFGRTASSKRN